MDLLQQTDAIFFDKTGLDLARTQKIVSDALASGDDGELFLEMRHSEMLMFDDGRLKTEIGRAHVRTPVTSQSRMPSSA